ncbi:MAG: V-type ATPase 116kDa subunit family protein, partial [bacterium]
MSRLLVLGPKRLLGQVIEEVQRVGVLHVDHVETEDAPVTPIQLSEEERNRVQVLEGLLARIEGVLTLLPLSPAGTDQAGAAPLTVEEIDARAAEIERRVRELSKTRLELEEERSLIDSYEGAVRALSPLLNALAGSKTLESVGFLLNTKDLTAVTPIRNELVRATGGRVEVASRIVDENRIGVVIAFRKHDADLVRPVLSRMGISELRLPGRFAQPEPADTLALMERRKREIPAEIQRIDRELVDIARADRRWMTASRAVLIDQMARMKVLPELAQSHYTFVLHGWAPTRKVPEVRARLRERFGGETVVHDLPVDPHEDPGRVPVMLDNPPFIRPFQRLLALFQPPRYGAWDPSPVMAITFPFFVGAVIGDVAYGLLLFWLGWVLRGRARAGKPLVSNFLNLRFEPPL